MSITPYPVELWTTAVSDLSDETLAQAAQAVIDGGVYSSPTAKEIFAEMLIRWKEKTNE